MENIKVGIVGLGRLGKVHAKNLANLVPNCELYAACSLVEEERKFAKEKLNVTLTYDSYEDMVKDPNIDAVFIVSPSGFHCQQIKLAMENGKHVFSEKPLGLDVEEIKETQKLFKNILIKYLC